ncbi:MAG: c-type cytochrome [Chitinophagaceae bacterium]
MLKKIFKWLGITLLLLFVCLVIAVASRQNLHYDAPYPELHASADSNVIARGKEIVFGPAHCADCHSTQNADSLLNLGQEPALTGGVKFALPLGEVYSKNITPDNETGIGRYTDKEIARALRYGLHPDGTVVYDFMPFHNITDEDLTAVISYMRSRPAAKNTVPPHHLNVLGNTVKAFLVKPVGPSEKIPATITRDSSAAYGRYLAYNMAGCNGCHTMRDMAGSFIGEPFAGGGPMEAPEGLPVLTPFNLTTDSSSRLFGWSQQMFIKRFRQGKIIPHSHMPWDSYKRMSENDLKALYNFLKTLPAVKTGTLKKK